MIWFIARAIRYARRLEWVSRAFPPCRGYQAPDHPAVVVRLTGLDAVRDVPLGISDPAGPDDLRAALDLAKRMPPGYEP